MILKSLLFVSQPLWQTNKTHNVEKNKEKYFDIYSQVVEDLSVLVRMSYRLFPMKTPMGIEKSQPLNLY